VERALTIHGKVCWPKLVVLLSIGVLSMGVLGIGWAARHSILRSATSFWVISDQVSQADAIVVLGGRVDIRPAAAAELYKQGLAPQILIPRNEALDRQTLLHLGIPSQAIMAYGNNLSSTYDEARAVAEWMTQNGARRIIVVAELFGSRRVRWVFNRVLAPIGAGVQVFVAVPQEYNLDHWWAKKAFLNEVFKYLYYRLRY
jgi:uncharacterized SAM-binding protein YcdF (DUF218 family)